MKKILKITTVSILSLIILLLLLMTLGIVITNKPQMQLGLNGVHQLTETNNNTYAAVGSWTSPNTFSIDCEIIGYSTKDKWNFTFDEDEILIEEVGVTRKYNYGGKRINNRIIKE